jgi:hypothetical protein
MPQISISEGTYSRLEAFLPLARYLNDGPLSVDDEGETLMLMGMDSLLRTLWEKQDAGTLVDSLLKLAKRHSAEVIQFVTDVLVAGGDKAEEMKKEFGFAQWLPKQGTKPPS